MMAQDFLLMISISLMKRNYNRVFCKKRSLFAQFFFKAQGMGHLPLKQENNHENMYNTF